MPFSLVRLFNYVTLDLRWAALYNELNRFETLIDKVVNVHLRGKFFQGEWFLDHPSTGFYEALKRIRDDWGYGGLLTMEPDGAIDGPFDSSCFKSFIKAMRTLRAT